MTMGRLKTVAALLPALVFIIAAAAPVAAAVATGEKAPDFSLASVVGTDNVKLSSYTDKPTLLVFWVSWCPHCQSELPVLQTLYKDLAPKGLNMVGVSVDSEKGEAKDFVEHYSLTFPNAYAGTEAGEVVLEVYGVRGVPALFVIDKGGKVAATYTGTTSSDTLKKDFAKLGVK